MSYDEGLGERIRGTMDHLHWVSERKMFGGLAFMVRGHMAVGVVKDELMVRVGPEACAWLIDKPHARAMDFTGRAMTGFLFVEPPGLEDDHDLAHWVGHGVEYALSLPPKTALVGARPQERTRPKTGKPRPKR
ncbi:MAG: TfoX/Sxy family protein [Vicinamibacteria bacterium]|nr:TfoX/Sxy family protein [Vicinamibacteria bacterium]